MGGMFTTLKVRQSQKPGDYSDPGWYKQPAGTQAYEWTGSLPAAHSQASPADQGEASIAPELRVKKPGDGQHKH
jgi:hypothetical protein